MKQKKIKTQQNVMKQATLYVNAALFLNPSPPTPHCPSFQKVDNINIMQKKNART